MKIIKIEADDNTVIALCAGQIHRDGIIEITSEKILQANAKLQEIFESLGFVFCDCPTENNSEENAESFAFPTHIEI